jgi:hypothetical protein
MESGKSFAVDVCFKAMVRGYPLYLKKNILEINGAFVKRDNVGPGGSGGNSSPSGSGEGSGGSTGGSEEVMSEEGKKRRYPARQITNDQERGLLNEFYDQYESTSEVKRRKITLGVAVRALNLISPGRWDRRRIQKFFDNIRLHGRLAKNQGGVIDEGEVEGEVQEDVEIIDEGEGEKVEQVGRQLEFFMPADFVFACNLKFSAEGAVEGGPGWDSSDWRVIPPLMPRGSLDPE